MSQMPLYRYPGAKPFETEQESIFYGRQQDTDALYRIIRAEPLVVLYAKSGLGKSSLLNAGIIPRARNTGDFIPVIIRFQAYATDKLQTPEQIVRKAIAPYGSETTFLDTLIQNESTLWQDLKEAQIQGRRLLLVFDQFEELFTYPKGTIEDFKQQLAEALFTKLPQRYMNVMEMQLEEGTCELSENQISLLGESPEVHVVLAIRSDRTHLLNSLNDYLPTIQRHTFELTPLSIDGAKEAILSPAHDNNRNFIKPCFDYDTTAVQKIIDFLTQTGEERIESTQLQIICKSVETKIEAKNQVITSEVLGDLTHIVGNFYYDTLSKITNTTQYIQARCFIEDELIFEKGNEEGDRMSIYEGIARQKFNLSSETIRILVNEHLLREEPRLQGEGYALELSHDTLVAPVLKAKAKRYEQERLRREAAELIEAKKQAQIEKRRRQLATFWAVVSSILFLISALAGFYAYQKQKEAISSKLKAHEETAKAQKSDSLARVARDSAVLQKNIAEHKTTEAEAAKLNEIAAAREANRQKLAALLANNNTDKALKELKITSKQAVTFLLSQIDYNILELAYDSTFQKCEAAINLKEQMEEVEKRIIEISFFYTETENFNAAVKMLSLLQIRALPNYKELSNIIQQRTSAIYFVFLKDRYYPTMVDSMTKTKIGERGVFLNKLNDFKMAKTETTVWQYFLFQRAKKYKEPLTPAWQWKGNHPIVNVTWEDAILYCNWLSTKNSLQSLYNSTDFTINYDGKGYRLPSEAEWEFAAKGGEKTENYTFSGSNNIDEVSWYIQNSKNQTHSVATKKANELGLFDMCGNAAEWCNDWYDAKNEKIIKENPRGPQSGTSRVYRGGGFSENTEQCQIQFRSYFTPQYQHDALGFRVVTNN